LPLAKIICYLDTLHPATNTGVKDPVLAIMLRAPLLLFWISQEGGVYCFQVLFWRQTKESPEINFDITTMAAKRSQRAVLNGKYCVFKYKVLVQMELNSMQSQN